MASPSLLTIRYHVLLADPASHVDRFIDSWASLFDLTNVCRRLRSSK